MLIIIRRNKWSARILILIVSFFLFTGSSVCRASIKGEKVIAFYSAKSDMGHISFVHEANRWFTSLSQKYDFIYDSTDNWSNLNDEFLSEYTMIIFLDTRPDSVLQRKAFERFMESGGSFMGFHFSAFALTPSAFPQNWEWYHNRFIGAGEYKGNTWRPTSAILRVEDMKHPATCNLSATFRSSPNEWYSWQNDLRHNKDIKVLLSIDSSSFPLGTGPKQNEIWTKGYYPVVWTNESYKMLYINMGHNDIDYEGKTNAGLSNTFGNEMQDRLIKDGLLWLLRSR